MNLEQLIAAGWKPLTYPYAVQERGMMSRALAQLDKGNVEWVLGVDTHEGVEGVAIYTKPQHVFAEDV